METDDPRLDRELPKPESPEISTRQGSTLNPESETEGPDDAPPAPFVRSYLESLAVFVGIPALTLYPLGFAALLVQILRDPEFPSQDLYMAWYATSMVPRIVVMGTAGHVLFLSLIATIVGMSFAPLVSLSFRPGHLRARESRRRRFLRWVMYALLPIFTISVLASVWALAFPYGLPNRLDIARWSDLWFLLSFVVLTLGAGVLGARALGKHWGRSFLVRRAFPWLFASYVMTLVASVCIASIEYPALPTAQVQIAREESKTPLRPDAPRETYRLIVLAHDSEHWDFYSNETGVLSVPDENADIVRLLDPEVDRDTPESP